MSFGKEIAALSARYSGAKLLQKVSDHTQMHRHPFTNTSYIYVYILFIYRYNTHTYTYTYVIERHECTYSMHICTCKNSCKSTRTQLTEHRNTREGSEKNKYRWDSTQHFPVSKYPQYITSYLKLWFDFTLMVRSNSIFLSLRDSL